MRIDTYNNNGFGMLRVRPVSTRPSQLKPCGEKGYSVARRVLRPHFDVSRVQPKETPLNDSSCGPLPLARVLALNICLPTAKPPNFNYACMYVGKKICKYSSTKGKK